MWVGRFLFAVKCVYSLWGAEMLALKGRYDGRVVVLDGKPPVPASDVIVTFLDSSAPLRAVDDGSLTYLFKDYADDGIREPLVDFGEAVGNEQSIIAPCFLLAI
jgi:hypothetical protein